MLFNTDHIWFRFLLIACSIGMLQSCGDRKVLTGVFLDSAVEGITYVTDSLTGITNELGEFEYRDGEEVSFYLNELWLGSAEGAETITPLDLVGVNSVENETVTNMIRLLQTLDDNDNLSDGIRLSELARTTANSDIVLTRSQLVFELEEPVLNYVRAVKGEGTSLVNAVAAQEHLRETLDELGSDSETLSVSAGSDRDVSSGSTVTLTGIVNGEFTSFGWEQDSTDLSIVTLEFGSSDPQINLEPTQIRFEAPIVVEETQLNFTFSAENEETDSAEDTVVVTVNP